MRMCVRGRGRRVQKKSFSVAFTNVQFYNALRDLMRKISLTTLSKIIHFLLSLNPDNNFLPNFSLFFLIVKMRLKIANFLHLMRAREGNFHSLFCIISYLYLFMLPYSQSGLEGFHVVIAIHIFSQTRVHFLNESYIFFFFLCAS